VFSIKRQGGTVRLTGRFDASQVEAATAVLSALDGPTELDCSGLDYISSAGLGLILVAHKRLQDAGHTLTMTGVSQRIRNVFHYAGLDGILTIE
jgi:anti-sigma B factor antagonist